MLFQWAIEDCSDQNDAVCKVVILASQTSTKLGASVGPRITETEEDVESK